MKWIFALALILSVEKPLAGQVQLVNPEPEIVRITGARFAYPLLQHWIDRFNTQYPEIQVVIEARGSSDPADYDVLIEGFEQSEEVKQSRVFLYVGRYVIVPVTHARSPLAVAHRDKGLTRDEIRRIFFRDIFADDQGVVKTPYTAYTRLQKAAAPIVFSRHFGFTQKDLLGKAVAGADEHLIKAVLRDTTGVTYAPLPLLYTLSQQGKLKDLTILPLYSTDDGALSRVAYPFANTGSPEDKARSIDVDTTGLPNALLHLSIGRDTATKSAITFLNWIHEHGSSDLQAFGFLDLPPTSTYNEAFQRFVRFATADNH